MPPWQDSYRNNMGLPTYTREQAAALGISIAIADPSGSGDKHLRLVDNYGGMSSRIDGSLSSPASHVVAEFYLMRENSIGRSYEIFLRGATGGDFCIWFRDDGWIALQAPPVVPGNPNWIHELMPYVGDTWYYMRRELDCSADLGSFYVEEVGNPSNSASFSVGQIAWEPYNTAIHSIAICTTYTGSSTDGSCVDNIKVSGIGPLTPVPTPSAVLLGVMGLAMVAWVRKRRMA